MRIIYVYTYSIYPDSQPKETDFEQCLL